MINKKITQQFEEIESFEATLIDKEGNSYKVIVSSLLNKEKPKGEVYLCNRYSLCPVCRGTGHVPSGFYSQGGVGNMSSNWSTTCRACNGAGVLKN